jgi:hypothetical protein
MKELKKVYQKFLKFKKSEYSRDVRFWFGVEKGNFTQSQILEVIEKYEMESFLNFLRKTRDIIFSKNPLSLIKFWSEDLWPLYYCLSFLKKEGIIGFKKDGKIELLKKKFSKIFIKKREEKEIQEIIEKKLKRKLPLQAPSNFIFGTKITPSYDQLPISVSSAIFIVKKILDYLPLGKKILFVGDDDLISLYLSLAEPKFESLVIDIDEKLLERIQKVAKKFRLKIETKKVDITKTKKLKEEFIGFLTNPVYTFEGIKTFVDFGVNQLSKDGGYVFLSISDEAIGTRVLFLEEFFVKKNLKIEEVIKEKVYYPFNFAHPEDEVIFKRLKNLFKENLIKRSPMIGASFWIFERFPFKIPKPKKQPLYVYL